MRIIFFVLIIRIVCWHSMFLSFVCLFFWYWKLKFSHNSNSFFLLIIHSSKMKSFTLKILMKNDNNNKIFVHFSTVIFIQIFDSMCSEFCMFFSALYKMINWGKIFCILNFVQVYNMTKSFTFDSMFLFFFYTTLLLTPYFHYSNMI